MVKTVECALVNSRLHYANAVLYGTSAANTAKLQRVQNALARVVTLKKRTVHIRPVLEDLQWLPINYCIDYKVASLVHKVRSTGSSAYLQALVSDYTSARQLRSSKQLFLRKPPVRTEIAKLLQLSVTTYHSIHAPLLHTNDSDLRQRNIFTNCLSWTDHVTVSAPFLATTYGALSNTYNNNTSDRQSG